MCPAVRKVSYVSCDKYFMLLVLSSDTNMKIRGRVRKWHVCQRPASEVEIELESSSSEESMPGRDVMCTERIIMIVVFPCIFI